LEKRRIYLLNSNSNIEIIEYKVTVEKSVKEGCCYKTVIVDNGFNYSSDVEFFVIKGTILNKNDNLIKKLYIIGNFYDIDGKKLCSRVTKVSNLSYLTKRGFVLIVEKEYSFKVSNRIDYIKFEFYI